jgi:hypothetical protein
MYLTRHLRTILLLSIAWLLLPETARADYIVEIVTPKATSGNDTWSFDYSSGVVKKNGVAQTIYENQGSTLSPSFQVVSGSLSDSGLSYYIQTSAGKYVQFDFLSSGTAGQTEIDISTHLGLGQHGNDFDGSFDNYLLKGNTSLSNSSSGAGNGSIGELSIANAIIQNSSGKSGTIQIFASATGYSFPLDYDTATTALSGYNIIAGGVTAQKATGVLDTSNTNNFSNSGTLTAFTSSTVVPGTASGNIHQDYSLNLDVSMTLNKNTSVQNAGGQVDVTGVPEPGTWALCLAGAVVLGGVSWLRSRPRRQWLKVFCLRFSCLS